MNLLLRKLPTAKRVHGYTAARPSGETIGYMQVICITTKLNNGKHVGRAETASP